MLTVACDEAIADGLEPHEDAAVAIISWRIGFASPADGTSERDWQRLISACEENYKGRITLLQPRH